MRVANPVHLELIDELIDDLPEPLVGQLEVDGRLRGEDVVEELAVVVVALEPLLNSGTTLGNVYEFTSLPSLTQNQQIKCEVLTWTLA